MTRTRLLFVCALTATMLIAPNAATASPEMGGPGPVVLDAYWRTQPHVVDPECHEDCGWAELVVETVDPNSSIFEVQVHLGEGQPFYAAHTWCVQGKQPGTPATLVLPGFYQDAGTFTVEIQAFSSVRCNFRSPMQESPIFELETVVLP